MDPIAAVIRWYLGLFGTHDIGAAIFQIGILAMIGCACLPGMMRARQRYRERQAARMSRVVIARIRALLPEYRAAARAWCARVEKTVAPLAVVAEQIPGDVKMKAERDFCVLDSSQPEAVAMLQM